MCQSVGSANMMVLSIDPFSILVLRTHVLTPSQDFLLHCANLTDNDVDIF